MCLSLILRLIGERGNRSSAVREATAASSNGAPDQGRQLQCGCYCGIGTPRNRIRWLSIFLLFMFASAALIGMMVFAVRLELDCITSALTPDQREDCYSGKEPLPQMSEECQEAVEAVASCVKSRIDDKGLTFRILFTLLLHVTRIAFIACFFILCIMCCCTKPPSQVAHGERPPQTAVAAAEDMPATAPAAATDSTTVPLLQP